MEMAAIDELGYLTGDLPGIGGELKRRPEDFVVDEIPLFEPRGEGDHLYLRVEKRKRLTTDVVRYLSDHFDVPRRAIGYAGLKDKHAVARQWFSVEHADEERALRFHDEHIQIIDIRRNDRQLKRGNLRGNRFGIFVRGVEAAAVVRAKRVLDRLAAEGAPNFIGHQRFGYRRDNHLLGRHLLMGDPQAFLDRFLGAPRDDEPERNREARLAYEAGDYEAALRAWPTVHRFERQATGPLSRGAPAADAVHGIDKTHRSLMVSAFQSAIFNRLLDERLRAGRLGVLERGDIAFKHETRGMFEVENPAAEQPRADALELSPTGPMWGRKMTRAGGAVGERERAALLDTGVGEADLAEGKYTPAGTRRAFRMPVAALDIRAGADEHGPYVYLSFELPRGCFATVVMREIMK